MIKFQCEFCFQEYNVRDDRAGQTLKCKSCGQKMRVPSGDDDLQDDLYEEDEEVYQRSSRPVRKQKSSSGSKKKQTSKSSNSPVAIVVGICAFGLAFFVSYFLVRSLVGGGKPEQVVQQEPQEVVPEEAQPASAPAAAPAETQEKTNAPPEQKPDSKPQAKQKPAPVNATPNPPSQPQQQWTSLVDPPLITADWPESSRLKIDLKNAEEELVVPSSSSPVVAVHYKNRNLHHFEIWNLATEKKIGELTFTPPREWLILSPKFKLSVDGKYLLAQILERDTNIPKLICWDTTTGKIISEMEIDAPRTVISLYEICGDQWAFVQLIRNVDNKFKTILKRWDLKTGKLDKEVEIKSTEFASHSYAISPGGHYLVTNASNKIFFYDLQTLKLLTQQELDGSYLDPRAKYYSLSTVNFSTDGKELGLLLTQSGQTEVWIINLKDGQPERKFQVAGNLSEQFREPSYSGNNLELTPSGKSFLLYGALLVDRQTQRSVWLFQPPPNVIIRRPLYLTPHYLFAGTDSALKDAQGRLKRNRKPQLVTVPLPEKQITDSLAAYQSQSDVILGAGTKVSIDINVGAIKFGKADEVKEVLQEVLQERLEADGLEVAADQPLVFQMEYQEQEGNKLQMSKRTRPSAGNPLGRTPTGETLQTTAAAFKLSWIDKPSKRTLWSKQVLVNPRFLILRNATEQAAREQMFEGLQNRLMGELIPYFIPKEKGLSRLPGETPLPE
ncbi:hypothetical protein Enr10x_45310 [Gimesia panareensis]|uniref:Uncharacterized protein n=1 Tax=Gimesia panareensis TaxID=2527978 RepID=A0A517QC29_9PLAN|nr:hypothetical protein [Gimesia panareensis]QDT29182.1 hypothetical protein Enr10x_45310 [Gimesia panareensis]